MDKNQRLLDLLKEGNISPDDYVLLSGQPLPDWYQVGAVGDGAKVVQGDQNILAEPQAIVVQGDNNHVNALIQQTDTELSEDQLRHEIEAYLNWLIAQNSTLTLRGVQRHGRNVIELKLDTVYVPLAAVYDRRRIELDGLLKVGNRLIITGGPGCGKTTVLMHMAWVLAEALARGDREYAQQKLGLADDTLPIPILVPVNRYANHLRQVGVDDPKKETLAAFISAHMIKRQATLNLPADFFRQLLKKGKPVVLLLDGLDEVPNETERSIVSEAIEDLVAAHKDLRVLVTCRTAAYNGRVALGQQFQEVKVLDLNPTHRDELINQAYQAVEPQNVAEQQRLSRELQEGIAKMEAERQSRLGGRAEPLVTSPLLVRMLLIVHLGERRLPQQRAELYSKAVDNMLLPDHVPEAQVRDELSRMVGGDRAKHMELAQYIAFHMHQQGDEQGREIDEPDLRRLLKQKADFAPLIESFIATTRERGTLMEERLGTYRFIHLAFQEFLVARYMMDVLLFEQQLDRYIQEYQLLTDSWWREPLLLLGGYLSFNFVSPAKKYIRYLVGLDDNRLASASAETRWAAAELAGTIVLAWSLVSVSLKKEIARRMAELISELGGEAIPAASRVAFCRAFEQLGDPRDGVGVGDDGWPIIAWGEVVPVGDYAVGGDSQAYERKSQRIPIARPYQLACYPITTIQFQAFVDAADFGDVRWWQGMPEEQNVHGTIYKTREIKPPHIPHANHPRELVSWYQAVAFCLWLSDKLGESISLPHEREWEVAARFDDDRFYPYGNEFDERKGNTDEGGVGGTTTVGLYPTGRQPNLNLYDMSGNVWEWCQNKYGDPADNGIDSSNSNRVLRGGSWVGSEYFARAAYRDFERPFYRDDFVGFRVVRYLAQS